MKRLFIFIATVMLFLQHGQAQQSQDWAVDFDGALPPARWSTPSGAWMPNTALYLPGLQAMNPKSYHGLVPNRVGDSAVLLTETYNCNNYNYIFLQFSHICKLSQHDALRIEYGMDMGGGVIGNWTPLPSSAYLGSSINYGIAGFNTLSYPEWQPNDSLALPTQSWWKEELFDLSQILSNATVQFRFIIKHGSVPLTQSYFGWLLGSFQLTAATFPINPPTVKFVSPLASGVVYEAEPVVIQAIVKSNTSARIETPWLKYTAMRNGTVFASDSVLMTSVQGDSLWRASLPKLPVGSDVAYYVNGRDIAGNTASARSGYTIQIPPQGIDGYTIIGTDTFVGSNGSVHFALQYYQSPMNLYYGYSFSRQLYLASEFSPAEEGGLITKLAWQYAHSYLLGNTAPAWTYENQSCYFMAVDEISVTSGAYIDPDIEGATLVWEGSISAFAPGWLEITLDKPFLLPPGKNLLIFWNHKNGRASGGTPIVQTWCHTSTPFYQTIYGYNDVSFQQAVIRQCTTSYYRANARFFFEDVQRVDNSVALQSIDMNDSIIATPNHEPIVVTLYNEGILDLNFATFSYTINGGVPKDTLVTFTPALPWSFDRQIIIGSYQPNMDKFDTIVVWVSLPNGQANSITTNDTLTKIVYGTGDVVMGFTQTPADTVNRTGPFDVKARIYSLSGTAISSVSLHVASTLENNTKRDTLPMHLEGSDIWTASIPQKQFGSDVEYTVKFADGFGNNYEMAGSYFILKPEPEPPLSGRMGDTIVGTGTTANQWTPIAMRYFNNWSRQLYYGSEMGTTTLGGAITHLAWEYNWTAAFNVPNQRCYFKAVDDVVAVTGYEDPATAGYTLVWSGTYTAPASVTQRRWVEIVLDNPFFLPPGKNLMIYWISESTGIDHGASFVFYHTTTTGTNRSVYSQNDNALPTTAGTAAAYIANARFHFGVAGGAVPLDNAVSLESINTPGNLTTNGVPTPVQITIRNMGENNLDSCRIHWTVNGIPYPSISYYGGLPEDFTDTITIGTYPPSAGKQDTIVVWVSMPNNTANENKKDTLQSITPMGCGTLLSGPVTVGGGGAYATIANALDAMRSDCGIGGDVTLLLADDTYTGSINFTDINVLKNHTLTIQSANGNRNGVILSSNAVTISLNNAHNIVFKDITITSTNANASVVAFAGEASNITFDNCVIAAAATATSYFCIEKTTSSSKLNNLTVKNCLINGGQRGIYINMANATGRSNVTNLFIDSNEFINQRAQGIYLYYVHPDRISYNKLSPHASPESVWRCIYVVNAENAPGGCKIIGNRISANVAGINSQIYGIQISGLDTVLVANNEVHLRSYATNYARGISVESARAVNIVHNSVLLTGTGGSNGFQAVYWSPASNTNGMLKNNVLVANGGNAASAYAIYIGGQANALGTQEIDYNAYFSAGTNLGYIGLAAKQTLADWKNSVPMDNSTDIRPFFNDSLVNLKISNYGDMICPLSPLVTEDMEGKPRIGIATKGCYESIVRYNNDGMLVRILGLENGYTTGINRPVRVVVQNKGLDTLKSIQLEYLIDGNVQGSPITAALSLATEESSEVVLTNFAYTAGEHVLTVQIRTVNGVLDEQPLNDTIEAAYICCSAPLSGTVQIGTSSSADYPDIASALYRMELCGISGKVTLALEDGIYNESVDFSKMSARVNDTVELTALANNAIIEAREFGIKTGDWNNLFIKNITINLSGEGYGILLGSGSNIEIDGCTIHLDTTLAKGLSDENTHIGIYKPERGIAHNVRIVNNVIAGGYSGVALFAGNTNSYGTNWIFDHNTVQNAYMNSVYLHAADFLSISDNSCLSMSNATYTTTAWYGLTMENCNAQVIQRNKIHGKHAFTDPYGMFFDNLNANTSPSAIYNNEIILAKTGTSSDANAFALQGASAGNIYHNSIYVTETAASSYALLDVNSNKWVEVKNNNLVTSHSLPITIVSNTVLLDYNNYYTGGIVLGNYNGSTANNINSWQAVSGVDVHSISVLPPYSDLPLSLEVAAGYRRLICPPLPAVATDINNMPRSAYTAMGAYELAPATSETVELTLYDFPQEAVVNQPISIEVSVVNFGNMPVNNIEFEYSINGNAPVAYTWTPTAALVPLADDIVSIGTFNAAIDTEIKVWITKVNGVSNALTDTVSGTFNIIPLAEFTYPITNGTATNILSFDVHAKIFSGTGAPATQPTLQIETYIKNDILIDNITMVLDNGIWTANIPQQYYGSKVVYSLLVADSINNSILLKDSAYLDLQIEEAFEPYKDYNLAVLSVLSPINNPEDLCEWTASPVKILLANLGENDYDFSINPITIEYDITNPHGLKYSNSISIQAGGLLSQQANILEILSEFPILSGISDFKIWIQSVMDSIAYDDTITHTYTSSKIELPMDEYFASANLPFGFISESFNTDYRWEVFFPAAGFPVQPDSASTGMLRYEGTNGAMAKLSTIQLDMYGVVRPTLEFWYYHDATASPMDMSNTEVNLIVDGVSIPALTVYRRGSVSGWEPYTVDLTPYTSAQCVMIEFESMNRFNQVAQYIDRIQISVQRNLALDTILVSPISACDFTEKEVRVVMHNTSWQRIDFATNETQINLELRKGSNVQNFSHQLNSTAIGGYSYDTLYITTVDLDTGTYFLTAYLADPIDENPLDDTTRRTISIRPDIKTEVKATTDAANRLNCVPVGMQIQQMVTITNMGNLDVFDIPVMAEVWAFGEVQQTILDTLKGILQVGNSRNLYFESYVVPDDEYNYNIHVEAELACDVDKKNNADDVMECIDMDDIELIKVTNPVAGTIDNVGSAIHLEVALKNNSPNKTYDTVVVNALIIDGVNDDILLSEMFTNFEPLHQFNCRFASPYVVPNVANYTIKVFVNSVDNYPDNDTIAAIRSTKPDGISDYNNSVFALNQNSPNPAKDNTYITYRIPEDGQVILTVYSITGQTLHIEKHDAYSGKNNIKLNTTTLADGIYYYSMEYNGERLVKKMTIKK